MADVKLIIVEHLIKMHCDVWKRINSDEYRDDDKMKVYKLTQSFESIESALRDIAISENGISFKQ